MKNPQRTTIFRRFVNRIRHSSWWDSRLARKIIPRSDFAKNVGILSGGSAVAQGLNILTIPIFSRLYSPKDFGIMALFITISTIIGTISNGRYDLTILLPKKDNSAINLSFLGILISIAISMITLIIIFPLRGTFASLLGEPEIENLLLLIPLDIFLFGIYNIFFNWCNRKKLYRIMSLEAIIHILTIIIFRGALYFIFPNETGLIISYLLGRIASFIVMIIIGFRTINLDVINFSRIKKLAFRYKKFPMVSTPSALTNILSRNLTSIMMPNVFSSQSLGYYSISQSILGLPSSIISVSIGKVFFQGASVEKVNTGKAENSFKKTLRRLLIISIPLFTLIFLFIKPVITLFLGKEWVEAGDYTQILVPMYAIRFVSSSLSPIMAIYEKISQGWIVNLSLLFASGISIALASILSFSICHFLILLSALSGLVYLIVLFYYKKIAYNR